MQLSTKRNPRSRHTPRRLLFVCTGNYYRSRFAELLFNALAARAALDWRATSRGIAPEFGTQNIGPISIHAVEGLRARGVAVEPEPRLPLPLREPDLAGPDLIVALDEAEHRPYVTQRFPGWTQRVEYWHVPDLDRASADEALSLLEREIQALIDRLAKDNEAGAPTDS